MSEEHQTLRSEPVSGEVVECYCPAERREVVECYLQPCPMPGRAAEEKQMPQKRKRSRKGLWIFLLCFALLLALCAGLFFWNSRKAPPPEKSSTDGEWQELPVGTITIPVWEPEEDVRLAIAEKHGKAKTAQEIYQTVSPAVVTVITEQEIGSGVVGTGVIFTPDGYVLTNYHVVAGGSSCSVTLSCNLRYEAHFVVGDEENDLAVLKIQGAGELPAAELGDSGTLCVGDRVYAIGNPLSPKLSGTFTDGIVSAVDRNVEVDGKGMTLIQTNAALNSGNSGGPLINEYGQVVGINTIKMMSGLSSVEGLGFAIPSRVAERVVNILLRDGELKPEPMLGITVENLATLLPDGTLGAKVDGVTENSAAWCAGLKTGDVIVTADGEAITGSTDVLKIRRRHAVGDTMPMRVWRDGVYLDITLELTQAVE